MSIQALEFHPVFPFALPQVATVAFGGSHLEGTVRCVFLGCEARVFVSGTVDRCLGHFFQGLHRDYFLIKQEFIGLILGGGFKYFLFSPLFGEDSHVD